MARIASLSSRYRSPSQEHVTDDKMREFYIALGGASAVRSINSLASLQNLMSLEIDFLRHVHDLSVLAQLPKLTSLTVGGNWASFKNAHLTSLAFLHRMPQLEHLVILSAVVDDRDYSPLLALPALKSVRVMATCNMAPSLEELKANLPWSG